MWIIVLLWTASTSSNECSCDKFYNQNDCDAYTGCNWHEDTCKTADCSDLTTRCTAPKCLLNGSVCGNFGTALCPTLNPQSCNLYNGCYYDYTHQTCGIIKKCESLSVEQCNGSTVSGNKCVVDPAADSCTKLVDCKSLISEIACLSQYPNCTYQIGMCNKVECKDISDSGSCKVKSDCMWHKSKCTTIDCSQLDHSECNSAYCGYHSGFCQSCTSVKYSQIMTIGIVIMYLLQ